MSHVRRNVPFRYGHLVSSLGALKQELNQPDLLFNGATHLENNLEERDIAFVHVEIHVWMRINHERFQL
jgi:hypothetical protein